MFGKFGLGNWQGTESFLETECAQSDPSYK